MNNRRKSNKTLGLKILYKYKNEFKKYKIKNNMKNSIIDTIKDEIDDNWTSIAILNISEIINSVMNIKYNNYNYIDISNIGRIFTFIISTKANKKIMYSINQDLINKIYYDYYKYQGEIKEEFLLDNILNLKYILEKLRSIDLINIENSEEYTNIINDTFWDNIINANILIPTINHENSLINLVYKYRNEFRHNYIKKYMNKDIIDSLSNYYNKDSISAQYINFYIKLIYKYLKEENYLYTLLYIVSLNSFCKNSKLENEIREIESFLNKEYRYSNFLIIL